jgi:hypothetical protein
MPGMLKTLSFAVVLAVVAATTASAQLVAPFTESFDSGVPTGWTITVDGTGAEWDVDATPAFVGDGSGDGLTIAGAPSGPSAFGGTGGSLNYNDGTDYEVGVANFGSALSPTIDISGLGGSVFLNFQCNFEGEIGGTFDARTVDIVDAGTTATITTIFIDPFSGTPGGTCGVEGTYHAHSIDISAFVVGVPSIQLRYNFDTVDDFLNLYSGWFVDNLSVTCGDIVAPSTPTNLLPLPGATVPPTAFLDWTDATDTSSCGPGTVASYIVEIDDDPAFATINFTLFPAVSSVTTPALPAATWFWRVRAVDSSGNIGLNSTATDFIVELPLPPFADTLHVNTSVNGAQNGDPGFVDPVTDQTPVFSAIYRDGNTVDAAVSFRFQVSADPTFTILDFDSGTVVFAIPVLKDERMPDETINVSLLRDTVYFWRIQFTDSSALTSPFSVAQSFRIGDDFDFGVRHGSTHHGRRCYVATAAYGSDSAPVSNLMAFRSGVLESTGAGVTFSRWYRTAGAVLSQGVNVNSSTQSATRLALAPAAGLAGSPAVAAMACMGLLAALLAIGIRRM